jgi:hypothetical protein
MFGRMTISPTVQVQPDSDLHTAVAALLQVTEQPEIVRWVEFPASVLLFLLVPGDPESGAVYVLDRKKGTWYAVDFDDEQFGGYSVSQLEQLLKSANSSTSLSARRFGEQALAGAWSQESRRRRAFDRKNIPDYLPTGTP